MNLDFGIKDGKIIKIKDVESGLACDCFCPSCGSKLIARKGKKKQHHFAHYRMKECSGYLETVLHLASKEVLKNNNEISLPTYDIEKNEYNNCKLFKYKSCIVEKAIDNIIPDVQLIFSDKHKIFVEIKVTHGIDDIKLKKIKALNISTLEIDLGEIYKSKKEFSYGELEKIILYKSKYRKWIFEKNYSLNSKKHFEMISSRRWKELKKWKQDMEERRIKERKRAKEIQLYKKKILKEGFIGYLSYENHSLAGEIFYESKYQKVYFTRAFSRKDSSPKYYIKKSRPANMSYIEWLKTRIKNLGALWYKGQNIKGYYVYSTGYIQLNEEYCPIWIVANSIDGDMEEEEELPYYLVMKSKSYRR